MIDVETPYGPEWWLRRLTKKLDDRNHGAGWSRDRAVNPPDARPPLSLLWDYYRGETPLPRCADGWNGRLQSILRKTRTNYSRLVVQSVLNRVHPLGWRTAVENDRDGDGVAHRIAAVNGLDTVIPEALEYAFTMGDGYLMLGWPRGGSDIPTLAAEDPRQTITATDAATGETLAALKQYRDEWTGDLVSHVLLPGKVWVSRRSWMDKLPGRIVWDEKASGAAPTAGVPVYRIRNTGGVAEIEPHLDLIDRINEQTLDRMSIAKVQAFRQRAIRGLPDVYPADHPRAGEKIEYPEDAFLADPGALWRLPEAAEIWESSPIDLGPIRMAIKDDVEALVAVTGTPLHFVTPDAASGSAEGASTMRESLVFRAEARQRAAGSALIEAMAGAFEAMGDAERADRSALRVIWAPIERHSLSERMSAATQAKTAGLSQSSIYTDVMGYSPSELPRLLAERAQDLLFADTNTPVQP